MHHLLVHPNSKQELHTSFLNSVPFYPVSFRSIINWLYHCWWFIQKLSLLIWFTAIFSNSYSNVQIGKRNRLEVFFHYLLILTISLLYYVVYSILPAPFNGFFLYLFVVKMVHDFRKILAQQYLELPSLSSHMMFNQPSVILIYVSMYHYNSTRGLTIR